MMGGSSDMINEVVKAEWMSYLPCGLAHSNGMGNPHCLSRDACVYDIECDVDPLHRCTIVQPDNFDHLLCIMIVVSVD